jgi:hypothetical protein
MRWGDAVKLAAGALAAVLLLTPAIAQAKAISYGGKATGVKSGQTRGLPILVGFELVGRGCPRRLDCLEHASVRKLEAVDWAYPNCLEVLDSTFELEGSHPVKADDPHTFAASGSPEGEPQRRVHFAGQIEESGRASGYFEVSEAGCSTGRIHWTAKPE